MSQHCNVIINFNFNNENELKQLVPHLKELGLVTKNSSAFVSAKFHTNEAKTVLINYATYKSVEEYNKLWEEEVTKLDVYKKILSFNPVFDVVFEKSVSELG